MDFFKLIRVRWGLSLALFVIASFISQSAFSQQNPGNQQNSGNQQNTTNQQNTASQPAAEFTADEIVQILQGDPQLLAEAKTEIVAALRDRGYSVTQGDISDDRLFSTIRTDDRARKLMSDALIERGYVPEGAQGQEQQQTGNNNTSKPSTNGQQTNGRPGNRSTRMNGEPDNTGNNPPEGKNKKREQRSQNGENGPSPQSEYPLRNLPALRDLYTPSPTDKRVLERFGASLFRNSMVATDKPTLDVPVGPDYILGPGDELIIEYWGSSSQRIQATVDREGRVLLPEAGAIMVAGRSLSDATEAIRRSLQHQLRGISVDVTLAKLRTVRIYVVGDVKNPGAYDISSLSTPLSALIMAGGPTDVGSLRTVKHFRRKRLVETVDLYDLMLKGVNSSESPLESGDSILVPPIGPQVTVAGMVRRPAIYELHSEQTLDQALDLAGGVAVSGELSNIKVERIEAHERKEMISLNLPANTDAKGMAESFKRVAVKDGDVVTISSILPHTNQAVYLQGHVFRAGKYPYKEGVKVTDIIGSYADLLPEPADRAEIVRVNPPDYSPTIIPFSLHDILDRKQNIPSLQPFDTVRVFGRYETDAPKVSIYGEVLRPGEYPLSEHLTAAELVRLAGGFKRGAYPESADIGSYEIVNGERVELEHRRVPLLRALAGEPDTDVLLKPGDVLTIPQIGGWSDIGGAVHVSGQVLHPGRYGLEEGEKLSSLLKRAGGFLPEAYPNGAVLDRAQVREAATKNRDELIRRLEEQSLQNDGTGRVESPLVARQRQQLIDKLKSIQPSGRLVIHISTDIAKWENTVLDIDVRAGDTLIVPKTPNFVLVAGQVYNPTAITYIPGRHAGWYLRQSGGATSLANKKDIFVIRANGSVVGKGSGGWWSGSVSSAVMQPGDTIYVPDKIAGSSILKNLGTTIQMLSGVAVAASVVSHL